MCSQTGFNLILGPIIEKVLNDYESVNLLLSHTVLLLFEPYLRLSSEPLNFFFCEPYYQPARKF